MIDVTFQLLVFFILCTQFRPPQAGFDTELPKDLGFHADPSVPKEVITIYCQWDSETLIGGYVLANGARARVPVAGSHLSMKHAVPSPRETLTETANREAAYKGAFDALTAALRDYASSGVVPASYEISFAADAVRGAVSGTVPWAYVTLAIDAVAQRNKDREAEGKATLPVHFKFSDSLMVYSGQG